MLEGWGVQIKLPARGSSYAVQLCCREICTRPARAYTQIEWEGGRPLCRRSNDNPSCALSGTPCISIQCLPTTSAATVVFWASDDFVCFRYENRAIVTYDVLLSMLPGSTNATCLKMALL
jgi:hypothetical protein